MPKKEACEFEIDACIVPLSTQVSTFHEDRDLPEPAPVTIAVFPCTC